MDILEEAYRRVKANGGTCGVDGVTFEAIESGDLSEYLAVLRKRTERSTVPTDAGETGVYPKAEWNDAPVGHPGHSRPHRTNGVSYYSGTNL